MKKLILFLTILTIFTTSNAQAAYWVDSCVNDTHMISAFSLESNGTAFVDLRQPPIFCDFGCNNVSGKCNLVPEATTYYHGIGIMLLVLVMYLAYVIVKTRPKESEGA